MLFMFCCFNKVKEFGRLPTENNYLFMQFCSILKYNGQ